MILSRLSYKPGWEFRMTSGFFPEDKLLEIVVHTNDSQRPHHLTMVMHRYPIPPHLLSWPGWHDDDGAWSEFLFDCIMQIERHEAAEWFRIDGRAPYHPHRKEQGNV